METNMQPQRIKRKQRAFSQFGKWFGPRKHSIDGLLLRSTPRHKMPITRVTHNIEGFHYASIRGGREPWSRARCVVSNSKANKRSLTLAIGNGCPAASESVFWSM